jgi:hypothetical protein
MCGTSRIDGLERLIAKHRNREVFLMFARNHIVANEVYRLLLEWLPVDEFIGMAGRF